MELPGATILRQVPTQPITDKEPDKGAVQSRTKALNKETV